MDRSYSSIRHHHRHRRDNPSFSSSLLDSIYNSFDGADQQQQHHHQPHQQQHFISAEREFVFYRETMKNSRRHDHDHDHHHHHRHVDKWVMEKKSLAVGRDVLMNSSSTSSESSSGGGFSSSESDSLRRRPKPIRTSFSAPPPEPADPAAAAKPSGFVKTKSRALKIYGDLKKVKQPISPGGKLATFLNSIFNSNNAKKKNTKSSSPAANKTECSSASSFSRSCLSGAAPASSGGKRSVRFAEDYERRSAIDDRRRVQEVAIDLLKSYQMKKKMSIGDDDGRGRLSTRNAVVEDFHMRDVVDVDVVCIRNDNDDDDVDIDDDDDDVASCASSDLFELDNLSAIGIERYSQELPVYETTHFDTNRAIAKGLIL